MPYDNNEIQVAYVGAMAPEKITIQVVSEDPSVDLTLATSGDIFVTRGDGSNSTWSGATLVNVSKLGSRTRVSVQYLYATSGFDLPIPDILSCQARVYFRDGGRRRSVPVALRVMAPIAPNIGSVDN